MFNGWRKSTKMTFPDCRRQFVQRYVEHIGPHVSIHSDLLDGKVKCIVLDEECRRGAHLPVLGGEPVGG